MGEKWKTSFLHLLAKYNYSEKNKKNVLDYYNERFK